MDCRKLDLGITTYGDPYGKVTQLFVVGSNGLTKINPTAVRSKAELVFSKEDFYSVCCFSNGAQVVAGGKFVEFWDIMKAKKVNSDDFEYRVPTPLEVFPYPDLVLAATDQVCLFQPGRHLNARLFNIPVFKWLSDVIGKPFKIPTFLTRKQTFLVWFSDHITKN